MSHLMLSGMGPTNGGGGGGGFPGTTLLGAELGSFNYGAGRYVNSSSGSLDFRPGKTLFLSVDFASAAGASNEMLIGCYSGAYGGGGKGWVLERGASSSTIYLTRWDGGGYVAAGSSVRLGVRMIAITWKAADNTVWASVDGAAAANVGTLGAPNTDGTCVVAVGSPITTGNIYADSLSTGAVACFGLVNAELSAAQLAAASSPMNGATPLNRFTLPSQFSSPVVDFNAYRDWDGVASTITTQGSSPVTLAVTGAVTKDDTSEVYYATSAGMYHDSKLAVSEAYAVRHNAFARIRFTTGKRRVAIHQTSTIYSYYYTGGFASVGIFSGGTWSSNSTTTAANVSQVVDSLLPAGAGKTVDLVEGTQLENGGAVYGTYMSGIRLPTDAVITAPSAPANRCVLVGDSILNGYITTNAMSDAPVTVLRGLTSYAVTLLGWGSATSYEFTLSASRAAWVASVAQMLDASGTNLLMWELMTNDYGLNAQSAANYATNLGAFLDDLKVAVPGLTVKLLGAIARVSPAVETANGSGSTLDDYRTAASGLTSGRAWVTYANEKNVVTVGNYYSDGIHLQTAGAAELAASYRSLIGA